MKTLTLYYILWFCLFVLGFSLTTAGGSLADNALQKYENHGLSFRYPSNLKPMGPDSTKKIQGMLNQQLHGMGNTQVSVIALDVLLDLPAFRVMIAKERFDTKPTPRFLIEERQHFLTEAQKRGIVTSYGKISETTIAGHSAIKFLDLDKGTQGYGSRVRILCGKDTWNITFTGQNRDAYQQYQNRVDQMLSSVVISETCS
ncbi:MAG: hypothetical protein NPIRA04_33220 [Nitrospirales bacterium]|nr:MAG: hypothetical protein NPIRA04_33220 [Nitrospirales bacterium]